MASGGYDIRAHAVRAALSNRGRPSYRPVPFVPHQPVQQDATGTGIIQDAVLPPAPPEPRRQSLSSPVVRDEGGLQSRGGQRSPQERSLSRSAGPSRPPSHSPLDSLSPPEAKLEIFVPLLRTPVASPPLSQSQHTVRPPQLPPATPPVPQQYLPSNRRNTSSRTSSVASTPQEAPQLSAWQTACLNEAPAVTWEIWAEGSTVYRSLEGQERTQEAALCDYMHQLQLGYVRQPVLGDPPAEISEWLELTKTTVDRIGPWDRLDTRLVARYVANLEEFVFKVADQFPSPPYQSPVRPPGYRLWLRHNPEEKDIRDEVLTTFVHAADNPLEIITQCTSAQELIDHLARNRVWPLPWFGAYRRICRPIVQDHLRSRASWISAYLDLLDRRREVFFNETRGFVLQEAMYLLAFHIHEGFPDPLPLRRRTMRFIDWDAIERQTRTTHPTSLINRDHYSTLYINNIIKLCNIGKPKSLGVPVRYVNAWFLAVQQCLNHTLQVQFNQNVVPTLEMASEMVSIMQYAYDYLVISDRAEWPLHNPWVPRALFQQLQVHVDGKFEGKRAPLLTRKMLIDGREPMSEDEVKHRYLKHLKAQRDQAGAPISYVRGQPRGARARFLVIS
ncbi:hypothetical protein CALVIDRAFT_563818 [Calocera viscosa TUFC12733]|uniref:Uncharacterized protein n=1 Tax=Calocera viscosa (strain TUFC12733) TaxID=1330018 RepID=A0A167M499_CALVF|nr:hypothetical protein CALVIDRAFT_563818 [Calocera viscosa TUFC12733]